MDKANYLFSQNLIEENLKSKNWIEFRPLWQDDYDKWFCDILEELTICWSNKETFQMIFNEMTNANKVYPQYFIVVWEDTKSWKVISSWSVIIEKKFIHNWKSVWHIEDIVIWKWYRWLWLWINLITILNKIAEKYCYKTILDCDKQNLWFYKKCWLIEKSLWMAKYFD